MSCSTARCREFALGLRVYSPKLPSMASTQHVVSKPMPPAPSPTKMANWTGSAGYGVKQRNHAKQARKAVASKYRHRAGLEAHSQCPQP